MNSKIIKDKAINTVTVGELRKNFLAMAKNEPENPNINRGEEEQIPLSFDQLSSLGLLYKINKEVLHPLGITLMRYVGGISMGAFMTKDGRPIEYDEETTIENEYKLRKLKSSKENIILTHHLSNMHDQVSKPSNELEMISSMMLKPVKAVASFAPLSQLDRINHEGVKLSGFPLFTEFVNKLNLDRVRSMLESNGRYSSMGHPKYIPELPSGLNDITDLVGFIVYMMDKNFSFITFEGIDATGKQTISNLFKDFLLEVQSLKRSLDSISNSPFARHYFPDFDSKTFAPDHNCVLNFHVTQQNIPEYESDTGREIKNILHTDPSSGTLKYLFGLNRLEVQNRYHEMANERNFGSIRIYDRYVESSMAFTLAKDLIKNGYITENHIFSYNPGSVSLKEETRHRSEFKLKVIKDIERFEYHNLKLDQPNLIVLCHAPIGVIETRLAERSKHTPLDKHEKDLILLNTTQYIYHSIINDKSKRMDSSKGCQRVMKLDTYELDPKKCVETLIQTIMNFTTDTYFAN